MAELETEALVLRRVDYRDADWILTLLTRDAGKLSALARSARKSRRRFGGALLSFTVSRARLRRRPRSDLWTLTSATPLESFGELAADVGALAHASYGTELCRELLAAEVAEPMVFDLLVELFRCISARGALPAVLRGYELSLLRAVGLEPRWHACGVCGATADAQLDGGAIFDPGQGGVVCVRCSAQSRGLGVRPVPAGARRLLCACTEAESLLACADLVADVASATAARNLMLEVVQAHVAGPLKTLDFVAKMSSARG